jgi:ribonuclease HIII
MKAVLHNQAIANVVQKIDTHALDYIVIDQFAERGFRHLIHMFNKCISRDNTRSCDS